MKGLADNVQAESKRRIPTRTGRTRATSYSLFLADENGASAEVGFTSEVAWWQHEGVPPHPEPVSRPGPMTFYWEKVGSVVTLSHVNHPGVKPVRFLTGPLMSIGTFYGFRVDLNYYGPNV